MSKWWLVLCLVFGVQWHTGRCFAQSPAISFEFFGDTLRFQPPADAHFNVQLSEENIAEFFKQIDTSGYEALVGILSSYKEQHQLSDWLYYQLIRKTAEKLSPKADNYIDYTLHKWYLLCKTGYNARLALFKNDLLFYIQCDEEIFDIPYFLKDGKQYVCLNIHDYSPLDFNEDKLLEVRVKVPGAVKNFSYKVASMPDFTDDSYTTKDIRFRYKNKEYHFEVMVNQEVSTIFKNYPVVDYESYFNIPISKKTYNSLIPELRKNVEGMSQKEGVGYLMEFTRNAFAFETDQQQFGKEKRLSPELTLNTEYSDCDDRAALFFYLVKEIYDLPMIALLYPTHVTIAVKLDKPVGAPVMYKNAAYSVCEPTPQRTDLKVGELSPSLKNAPYQIAYEYNPL